MTGARHHTPPLLLLLDYDGTVTSDEANEVVLQRHVGDAWRPLEDEVRAGRMGHAECFARQVALLDVPRDELLATMLAAARPAPGLAAFLAALVARGARAAVVSVGLRPVIEAFWRREGLPPLPIYASELEDGGAGGGPPYRVRFNPLLGDCPRCGPAACKGAIARRLRRPGEVVVAFGDGEGDLCLAGAADLTFARGRLAELCAAGGLPWRPLDGFDHVWAEIDRWLAARG